MTESEFDCVKFESMNRRTRTKSEEDDRLVLLDRNSGAGHDSKQRRKQRNERRTARRFKNAS